MNDKLKLEKESHTLQNEKLLFANNVRVILTGNHYELYFRDIAAYENEETMRRISPSAFIVKKRGDVVYDDWFTIGCIIRNFFGEDGRQLFHEITKH